MYNRIAVIYRGHLRTWNYVKDVNFQFFDSISKNVDYYFVMWNLYDTTLIERDFKDRNLIKLLSVDIDGKFYEPDFGPPWLLNKLLPYKKERETFVKYDLIIDTRPDVIIKKGIENLELEEMTLYVEWDDLCHTPHDEHKVPGIGDICNIMSSKVYDIVCERYKESYEKEPLCHINNRNYCTKNNIKIQKYSPDFFRVFHIRPQMLESIVNPFDVLNLSWDDMIKYKNEWILLSDIEKKNILFKHNILLDDYNQLHHGIFEIKNPFHKEIMEKWKEILSKQLSPS